MGEWKPMLGCLPAALCWMWRIPNSPHKDPGTCKHGSYLRKLNHQPLGATRYDVRVLSHRGRFTSCSRLQIPNLRVTHRLALQVWPDLRSGRKQFWGAGVCVCCWAVLRGDCVAFVLAFDEDIPDYRTDERARMMLCWVEAVFKFGTCGPGLWRGIHESKVGSRACHPFTYFHNLCPI